MHDVHVVLARARVRCVSSARVSVGCAHTHVYCSLRYDYVEREEVGLRRILVDGSLLLARTSFLEEAPAPGMVIQLHKGNVDYGTPWELEHE
jgi:hypothetical protein